MTIALTKPKSATRSETQAIPPLQMGDRLTRAEFERRYKASTHIKKAELIEGVVYMPSPTRHSKHGLPHSMIITWLGTYWGGTPGVEVSDNATLRLDFDNEPQPDALLRLLPEKGGQSYLSEDDYLTGTPELIVEIAASTASYDMNQKKHVYARNGVPEYLVYLAYEERVVWFALREGVYAELTPDADGILRSQIFPGLWLNVPALLTGDMAAVLATAQKGIASDQHEQFKAEIGRLGD